MGAGDSEGTRTLDLLRDRQAFYSSELRSQIKPMSFALLYPTKQSVTTNGTHISCVLPVSFTLRDYGR